MLKGWPSRSMNPARGRKPLHFNPRRPQDQPMLALWVWLKIQELGLRRFYSLVPFTRCHLGTCICGTLAFLAAATVFPYSACGLPTG